MEGWKGKNEENGLVSLENTEDFYIYIYIRRCSYEAERFSLKFTFEEQRGGQERERDGKFRISEFFLDREV